MKTQNNNEKADGLLDSPAFFTFSLIREAQWRKYKTTVFMRIFYTIQNYRIHKKVRFQIEL